MLITMGLSILFLVFYIAHHLLTGETKYGDTNHDGILSEEEKLIAGSLRYVYYFIISTHITLAGIVMPFVLYSAYRALTADYVLHKKTGSVYLSNLVLCSSYRSLGLFDDISVLYLNLITKSIG